MVTEQLRQRLKNNKIINRDDVAERGCDFLLYRVFVGSGLPHLVRLRGRRMLLWSIRLTGKVFCRIVFGDFLRFTFSRASLEGLRQLKGFWGTVRR